MEARVLVTHFCNTFRTMGTNTWSKFLVGGSAVALILIFSSPVAAKDRQRISFYKINKDGITQSIRFTARKARKPGCHNFIRKVRLYQVVQFRYDVCHVYTSKSCAADSIMSFYREKEPETHTSNLSQGYGWHPVGEHERGEKAKSWHCE